MKQKFPPSFYFQSSEKWQVRDNLTNLSLLIYSRLRQYHFEDFPDRLKLLIIFSLKNVLFLVDESNVVKHHLKDLAALELIYILSLELVDFLLCDSVSYQQNNNLTIQVPYFVFAELNNVEVLDAFFVVALIFYHAFSYFDCILGKLIIDGQ